MKTEKKSIVVQVLRDSDGHVYSQVADKEESYYYGFKDCVVIDRQKGRGLDKETIKRRAESLAKLLGCPFEEDYTWPCVAKKKLLCRCPECIKAGR